MPNTDTSVSGHGLSAGGLVVDFKHIALVAALLAGGAGTSGFLAHTGSTEIASALSALQGQLSSLALSVEQIRSDLRSQKEIYGTMHRGQEDHEDRIRQLERLRPVK